MLQFIINLRHPNPPLTALPTHNLPLYLKQFRKVLLIDHHSCFSSRFRQCLLYFPTCQRARDKSGEFISLTNWSITISCVHRVLGQFFIAAAASHWPTASRFCLLYRDLSVKHVSRNLSLSPSSLHLASRVIEPARFLARPYYGSLLSDVSARFQQMIAARHDKAFPSQPARSARSDINYTTTATAGFFLESKLIMLVDCPCKEWKMRCQEANGTRRIADL